MTYITGDTHGDFRRYMAFTLRTEPDAADTMIVLGDAGLNYYGGEKDAARKRFVNYFPFSTFCIHGNHEMRPTDVPGYAVREFHGGRVWFEPAYPKLLFAMDGEVYDFEGRQCMAIGGAYSTDKPLRLAKGLRWFANEQPTAEIQRTVEARLAARDNQIDVVLSHTCPRRYVPQWHVRAGIDYGTEQWLGTLEARIQYQKWYCGHFHIARREDKLEFLYENIEPFCR